MWGRLGFINNSTMDSDHQQEAPRKKIKIKALIPEIAQKTGLSQEDVAKVCRLLMQQIQSSVENDEVFQAKSFTIRSSLKKAKPANEKRGPIPERRIGRLVIDAK